MEVIRLGAELNEYLMPGMDLPAPMERLITRGGGATKMPYFWLAKRGADLVICIRGAAEPGDFLIVLDFEGEAFQGGVAHRGVLKAARWIVEQCRPYIQQCTGRIICTGHSLGGATSGMVAAVLILEEKRQNVYTASFAPFPILTKNLTDQLAPTCTAFVYNNDIVPRLTHKNVSKFINQICPPGPNQQQSIMGLQQMVQMGMNMILSMNPMMSMFMGTTSLDPNYINSQIPVILQNLVRMSSNLPNYEYELPGKAYHLKKDQEGFPMVTPYTPEENYPINMMTISMYMQDHDGTLYMDSIFACDDLD